MRAAAARDEQQRGAARADLPQLRPVVPLMVDARHRERREALASDLDDDAVGVRLRFGDEPGECQGDSVAHVSPGEPAAPAP
jgi:hypothetical protein